MAGDSETSAGDSETSASTRSGKDKLIIFDTTLRDGEQSPGVNLNADEKVLIARQLSRLGVDVCEAGFPIASDGDFLAVQRIAREVGPEVRADGSTMVICGLARCVQRDIDRAYEAIRDAPRKRIHVFLATSDIHLQHKLKIDRKQCVERAVWAVGYARALCDDIEFSPEDAGRSDRTFLTEVLSAVIAAGATTLNIPDTVGYNTPDQFGATMRFLIDNTAGSSNVVWSTHCHNDLGLATANTFAGVLNGARQAEVTINGIGERAGNTSLEELVMILYVHAAAVPVYCNIETTHIYRCSQLVQLHTGMAVQPNKAIVGANAFAHESGIHQDGVLKHQATYEIIRPETIGLGANSLVLGKHSGRHAFRSRLEELGYTGLTEEQLNTAFADFKALTDKKKDIQEMDLVSLMRSNIQVLGSDEHYKLNYVQVSSGTRMKATATVSVTVDDEEKVDAATGSGSVDAVFAAIGRIAGADIHLVSYEVKAVTSGSDALGEVAVRISDRSATSGDSKATKTFHGHGVDSDVLLASAKAYVHALNVRASVSPARNVTAESKGEAAQSV